MLILLKIMMKDVLRKYESLFNLVSASNPMELWCAVSFTS